MRDIVFIPLLIIVVLGICYFGDSCVTSHQKKLAAQREPFASHVEKYVALLSKPDLRRKDRVPLKSKVAVLVNMPVMNVVLPNETYSPPPRRFQLEFSHSSIPSNVIASSPAEVQTLLFFDWEHQILSWYSTSDGRKWAAYKSICTVTAIDPSEPAVLAKKTFVGSDPELTQSKVRGQGLLGNSKKDHLTGTFPYKALNDYVESLFRPGKE